MTALEKIKQFEESYPGASALASIMVDYTDQIPANGGIFPSGLVEISRKTDICGNVTVYDQYNFGLRYIFEKSPGDDDGATQNAAWIMGLQEWVQEQSALGNAPVFGDVPQEETISAQNGSLFDTDEEGIAVYFVQISVKFTRKYEVKNKWLT